MLDACDSGGHGGRVSDFEDHDLGAEFQRRYAQKLKGYPRWRTGKQVNSNRQLMSDNNVDIQEFRRALSCFATGVAVVTTLDGDGKNVGITVSSFNSVSLDPPLVLWSIANDANSYSVFTNARYFAVNVLAMHQHRLSSQFAQRGGDKFEGLECRSGIEGIPILPEYAACFECSTENIFEGGDHKIIVGRVLKLEDRESDPLIFYRGRFIKKGAPYPDQSEG